MHIGCKKSFGQVHNSEARSLMNDEKKIKKCYFLCMHMFMYVWFLVINYFEELQVTLCR